MYSHNNNTTIFSIDDFRDDRSLSGTSCKSSTITITLTYHQLINILIPKLTVGQQNIIKPVLIDNITIVIIIIIYHHYHHLS